MTARVITPRHLFSSISELARLLDCYPNALYRYLEPAGPGVWRLRPFDPAMLDHWHRTVYRRPPETWWYYPTEERWR